MDIRRFIADRRFGRVHPRSELEDFARMVARNEIPDYQVSAWLMAACLSPLNEDETASLTVALANSGVRLDLTGLPMPWIDKHSTGGVGDKTTIVALPMMAACGLTVVKMSGAGLGLTGGTVDKLSSVPGFKIDLAPNEMITLARRVGLALTGQTAELAPADKVLYGLRDATSTVDSLPLIVSSILSKKLASGAQSVVLDVKCGSGSFMPDLESARSLARALESTAVLCGLGVRTAVTDMDQPLGRMVGNALEVKEAADVLSGRSQGRFRELCERLVGLALESSGMASNVEEGRAKAAQAIDSGAALAKARDWFEAQGANPAVLDDPSTLLPSAPSIGQVTVETHGGWVSRVNAAEVGWTSVDLGGGRAKKGDTIDPAVGIEVHVEVGQKVEFGQPLFTVHARDGADLSMAVRRLAGAVVLSEEPVPAKPVVLAG